MTDYIKAIFINRPNRFIANVEIDGEEAIAHVPNTGRCNELLVKGAIVYLLPSDDVKRKTKYSLHFVENEGALVSIYSQQANKIVYEAILNGKIPELRGYSKVEREKTIGNSRIDIYLSKKICDSEDSYLESNNSFKNSNSLAIEHDFNSSNINLNEDDFEEALQDCFLEVKGVTLIKDGIAQFPDAPTTRGKKHLEELIKLKKEGHRAAVFFLIQHPNGNSFRPNWENDPDFSKTLKEAHSEGVEILAYKCRNSLNSVEIEGKALNFSLNE